MMLLDSNVIIYAAQPDRADLRQQRKMSLGDAIIAGTALAYELTLATHNTEDFSWIGELKMLDPLVQNA